MRIHFERSGGVAGMLLSTDIDTDTLPDNESEQLCRLVEEAAFFDLPGVTADSTPGADQFSYVVSIETTDRSHAIRTSDAAAPSRLRPLLDWLNRAARRGRRRPL